jgi:hypothetical protein
MAILSGFLMLGVGLFTDSILNQALVVLAAYAIVLAGKLGGSGDAAARSRRCGVRASPRWGQTLATARFPQGGIAEISQHSSD